MVATEYDKPFSTAASMVKPLAPSFKIRNMVTHRVSDPWQIEDWLAGPQIEKVHN